jgi:protein subunit release factor A
MRWTLNPKEVCALPGGATSRSRGQAANTERTPSITLVHLPTGITVMQSAPKGQYSRPEAQKIREEIRLKLMAELEQLVAKHLKVPGR